MPNRTSKTLSKQISKARTNRIHLSPPHQWRFRLTSSESSLNSKGKNIKGYRSCIIVYKNKCPRKYKKDSLAPKLKGLCNNLQFFPNSRHNKIGSEITPPMFLSPASGWRWGTSHSSAQ